MWPFNRFRPSAELVREVSDLRKRVIELEDLQVRREIEHVEVRDKILRHLQRAAAIKQKIDAHEDRDEEQEAAGTRPPPAQVIAAKFGR